MVTADPSLVSFPILQVDRPLFLFSTKYSRFCLHVIVDHKVKPSFISNKRRIVIDFVATINEN
jgi:hypothetical protein